VYFSVADGKAGIKTSRCAGNFDWNKWSLWNGTTGQFKLEQMVIL